MPATIAHGFRFQPDVTDGWVMTFTEDVADALGDRRGEALARLKALAGEPVVPLGEADARGCRNCARRLHEERFLARAGFRIAMRGLLALIAVEVARLAAGRARAGRCVRRTDGTVDALRTLVEEHFQKERQLAFYADKLAMTVDRLNDHVKRATGVTAGHLIRQRVLTEAKRQLVFTASRSTRSPTISHSPIPLTSRASSASRPARRRTSFASSAAGERALQTPI